MKNAKEILDFYILSGITDIASDTPFDLNAKKPSKTTEKKHSPIGINGVELAKEISLRATSLEDIFEKMKSFDACSLRQNTSHTIIGKGNHVAKYMIIIDAPDNDDERSGKILSGSSGVFIKNFLKAMKINEDDCFFATFLPWRAPGNRAPTSLEANICKPFLEKQINLVNPQKIYAFGADVSKMLSSSDKTIAQLREAPILYQSQKGDNIKVIPSFSISYLLSNPAQKAKLWDFLIKCD